MKNENEEVNLTLERPPELANDALLVALLDTAYGRPIGKFRTRFSQLPGVRAATNSELRASAEVAAHLVRTLLHGTEKEWEALVRLRENLDTKVNAVVAERNSFSLVVGASLLVTNATREQALTVQQIAKQVRGDGFAPNVDDLLRAAEKRGRGPAASPKLRTLRVYAALTHGFTVCWPADESRSSVRGKLGRLISIEVKKREGG